MCDVRVPRSVRQMNFDIPLEFDIAHGMVIGPSLHFALETKDSSASGLLPGFIAQRIVRKMCEYESISRFVSEVNSFLKLRTCRQAMNSYLY